MTRVGWVSAAFLPLMFVLAGTAEVQAASVPSPPALQARSAAILDAADGRLLWSMNGHLRVPMASTTKMMTALVALQLLKDRGDVMMTVPPQVSEAYGEMLNLRPGDRYTFLQMLEGMLLPSANDAAITVAVDAAGSLTRFVALMNAQAQALGLDDTHFANPDGLEDPDHYSSADDLARLGWVVMQDPLFRRIVAMPSAVIPSPDQPGSTVVIGNINALLDTFPGATGVKTGYTSQAMNVVVGSATRGGASVVAVVTGESEWTTWSDEQALLRFGLALAAEPDPPTLPAAAPPVVARLVPAEAAARPVRTLAPRTAPAVPVAAGLGLAGGLAALLALWRVAVRRRTGWRVVRPTRGGFAESGSDWADYLEK